MPDNEQILTVNAGGTSLKIGLFDWDSGEQLADDAIDWSQNQNEGREVDNHSEAFDKILEEFDTNAIRAVGHRVVHGGSQLQESVRIDDTVKQQIEEWGKVAPLHNPIALNLIRKAQERLPDIPHIATFDTTFHRTLPQQAYMLPLPYEWHEKWDIRRFGFHGLNLIYCTERTAQLLGKHTDSINLVICHLGSGCSITAVKNGKSVATTMSFTPLGGVMMASRSGSVDPGLLFYLLEHRAMSIDELAETLNKQSGLKGLSQVSSDLRDLGKAIDEGHPQARIAYDVFVQSIREGIGQMMIHSGGMDALIFTDGVGENVAEVRADVTASLDWLGIELDKDANHHVEYDTDIATPDSRIRIFVIHNREALIIQRETRRIVEKDFK